MIWIEFTGPSGVGKSFWFEKVINQSGMLRPEKIVTKNFLNTKSNLSLKNKFYKILYQSNFKKKAIEHRVFNSIKSNFKIIYNKSDLLQIASFLKGLNNYDDNPINQLRLADFYYDKIKEYKLYENYLNQNDFFLSEDGIIHTNFGDLSSLGNRIRLPNLIINFQASDDFILKNRQKRIRSGNANLIEQVLNEKDLKQYIIEYNKKYRIKIENLKSMNTRVIDLNLENETIEGDNINQIMKIINSFNIKR